MKNKLLHFALDLFSASDDEEQDSIFAQVKIYRTASVRIFEYIIGILLLAIWLLTIVNITHVAAEEWHSCLIIAIFGTVSTGLSFRHSYHPSASDLPFVKISTPGKYAACRFAVACSLLFMHSSLYGPAVRNG